MKKIITLLISFLLVATLFVPVAAEEPKKGSITITNVDSINHSYEAYQIFQGDLVQKLFTVKIVDTNYFETTVYFEDGSKADLLVTGTEKDGAVENPTFYHKDGTGVGTELNNIEKSKIKSVDYRNHTTLTDINWGDGINFEGKWTLISEYYDIYRIPYYESTDTEHQNPVYHYDIVEKNATYNHVEHENNNGKNPGTEEKVLNYTDFNETAFKTCQHGSTASFVANKLTGLSAADTEKLATKISDYLSVSNSFFGEGTARLDNVNNGYYFIKEVGLSNNANSSYSRYMLQVAGDVKVTSKAALPASIKKVRENRLNLGNVAETDDNMPDLVLRRSTINGNNDNNLYNDLADYSIGDLIDFAIVYKMPANYEKYTGAYNVTFNDRPSEGLDIVESSIELHILNGTTDVKVGEHKRTLNALTTVGKIADGFTYSLNIKDLSTYTINANSYLILTYKAKLNDKAVVGISGNKNTSWVEYTNNPNGGSETGRTPDDVNVIYTYGLEVLKVNRNQTTDKLPKAKFKLSRNNGSEWAIVGENYKITGWTSKQTEATELVTGVDGLIKFLGLDTGDYELVETEAPEGFNKLVNPIKFTLTAKVPFTQSYLTNSNFELTLTVKENTSAVTTVGDFTQSTTTTGTVGLVVTNQSGDQLPVTGGAGTTMIYAAGIILVVGAGVALVVRRKSENK